MTSSQVAKFFFSRFVLPDRKDQVLELTSCC